MTCRLSPIREVRRLPPTAGGAGGAGAHGARSMRQATPDPARPRDPPAARPPRPHLWRARSWHQQLPPAHRPAGAGRLHHRRCLFARRPPGRRVDGGRPAVRCRHGPHRGGARRLRRKAGAPRCAADPQCRHRSLPPRRQRAKVRRPGVQRNRHCAGCHQRRRGGAAGGARLPHADRSRRARRGWCSISAAGRRN